MTVHTNTTRLYIFCISYFSTVVPLTSPVCLSSLTRHFQQVYKTNTQGNSDQSRQLATKQTKIRKEILKTIKNFHQFNRNQKKLQHPTRSVENVALTTKGLKERKHNL